VQQVQQVQQHAPQQVAAAPNQPLASNMPKSPDGLSVLQMIDTVNTYEQYVTMGWNPNQLVAQRHAQWVPVAPQTMQLPPQQPQVQQAPQQPQVQQAPQQPQNPQGFQTSGGQEDDLPF